MTIKTVVVLQEARTESTVREVEARVTELENAGLLLFPTVVKGLEYTRPWATEAAANDWISYQNSLVPPPASAVVVID